MKLVIIAAGKGSRLKSETKNNPKALTVINGHTIIDIILNNCVLNEINEIVIITGYDKTSIRSYLDGKWKNLKIDYIYNDEWNLENGISVLKAKSAIDENDEDVQVWYMLGWVSYLQGEDYKGNSRHYLSKAKEVFMNSKRRKISSSRIWKIEGYLFQTYHL